MNQEHRHTVNRGLFITETVIRFADLFFSENEAFRKVKTKKCFPMN